MQSAFSPSRSRADRGTQKRPNYGMLKRYEKSLVRAMGRIYSRLHTRRPFVHVTTLIFGIQGCFLDSLGKFTDEIWMRTQTFPTLIPLTFNFEPSYDLSEFWNCIRERNLRDIKRRIRFRYLSARYATRFFILFVFRAGRFDSFVKNTIGRIN